MGNPFAAIESVLNANVKALSNASATISGVSVDGVFDAFYSSPLDISTSGPVFTAKSVDLPSGVAHGTSVSIRYNTTTTAYTVTEVQNDGAGLTRLVMQ